MLSASSYLDLIFSLSYFRKAVNVVSDLHVFFHPGDRPRFLEPHSKASKGTPLDVIS